MSQQHLQTLCYVYQILASNADPHAVYCRPFKGRQPEPDTSFFLFVLRLCTFLRVRCGCDLCEHASLQIGNQLVHLQMQLLALPAPQTRSLIELHLSPVGAQLHIQTSEQLRSLATSLLTTAVGMHRDGASQGIVHCDIRPANIVQYRGEWVLIDWELAGPIDRVVWWRAKEPPPCIQLDGTWPIAAVL